MNFIQCYLNEGGTFCFSCKKWFVTLLVSIIFRGLIGKGQDYVSVDQSLALCKQRNIFVLLHFCAENMRWFCIAVRRAGPKIMIVTALEEDDEGDADIIRVLRKI